jgi:hypothetical protein
VFDWTLEGDSWVIPTPNSGGEPQPSPVPIRFTGNIGGVTLIGAGHAELFGAFRPDGTFFATYVNYDFPPVPTPEPTSALLVCVAMAAFARRRWRRRVESTVAVNGRCGFRKF